MKKDGGGGVKQRGCGVKFTEGTLNSRTLISREWAGLSSEAECILFGSHSIFFFFEDIANIKRKKKFTSKSRLSASFENNWAI